MHFEDTRIDAVIEFSINSFLVHVRPTNLLVVNNWQVSYSISESDSENIHKYWLIPLPRFDVDKFPFIVCSGYSSYNIVNIKTGKIDPLV